MSPATRKESNKLARLQVFRKYFEKALRASGALFIASYFSMSPMHMGSVSYSGYLAIYQSIAVYIYTHIHTHM